MKPRVQGSKARVLNIARGALALLRASSTPDAKRDRWKQEQLAHQQIHRALSLAKAKLPPAEVNQIETWILRQLRTQDRAAGRLGTSAVSLGLFPKEFQAQSLPAEISLAAKRVEQRRQALLEFCECVEDFQKAFLSAEWAAAEAILAGVSRRHGHSYWTSELAIATAQAAGGIAKMKAMVASLSPGTTGAEKFLLYFIGVRNEPAQAIPRFKATLAARVDDTELTAGLKAYFKYRLTHTLPLDDKQIAAILSAEQLTTDCDLLFTSLAVVRWLRTNPAAFSKKALSACDELASQLAPIALRLAIDIDFYPTAPRHDAERSNASTDLMRLCDAAMRRVWIDSEAEPHDPTYIQHSRIIAGIASKLSTRSEGVEAEDVAKLQVNFADVPAFIQLGSLDDVGTFPDMFLEMLRDPPRTVTPLNIREALLLTISSASHRSWLPNRAFAEALHSLSEYWKADSPAAPSSLAALFDARSWNDVELDALLVIGANIYQHKDQTPEAIMLAAVAGIRNQQLLSLLPLSTIFQGVRWRQLTALGLSIETAICLDLYLRSSGDRKARTYKRYAVEELMAMYASLDLSHLLAALLKANISVELIRYFFESVCDISTLELLPGVDHSRAAQELRIQVLRNLATIPGVAPGNYIDEAHSLEASLGVSDGLEMLDDSRVYVDESRVLSAINRELSADFQRYLHFLSAGIGDRKSLADIVKSLRQPTATNFQLPVNDADELFAEMTARVRDKFLNDPTGGLDIHIGRRIRHGTIASLFRGPLESRMLIGQRPKLGAAYQPPEAAVHACLGLDQKTRTRVYAAFARFSEAVDQLIVLLRDEYFHVLSKQKPRGIFDVPLTPMYLVVARGMAQACTTIDEYARVCMDLFWVQLASHMAKMKPSVEAETKRAINSAFEKLLQELKSLGVRDPHLLEQVQQGLEELRKQVPTMMGWVRTPKASVEGKVFSMQRIIDIAVALVRGQRPTFSPIVEKNVPEGLALDTYGLSVVVDALYIGLDNVFLHSDKKTNNQVTITVDYDLARSLLDFTMLSELGPLGRTSEKEAKLHAIRNSIAKRTHKESAKRDQNSGLSKLAILVLQSDDTAISFDYVGTEHFELRFSLRFVSMPAFTKRDSVEEFVASHSEIANQT